MCLNWCCWSQLQLAQGVREARNRLLRKRELHRRGRHRCFWQPKTPFCIVLVLAVVPTGVFRVHVFRIAVLVVDRATWGFS